MKEQKENRLSMYMFIQKFKNKINRKIGCERTQVRSHPPGVRSHSGTFAPDPIINNVNYCYNLYNLIKYIILFYYKYPCHLPVCQSTLQNENFCCILICGICNLPSSCK